LLTLAEKKKNHKGPLKKSMTMGAPSNSGPVIGGPPSGIENRHFNEKGAAPPMKYYAGAKKQP
jgi:hypothetical protein